MRPSGPPHNKKRSGAMRTQVGIVGAGPAGLMLALLLRRAGIDAIVLEARSRHYIEHRIRAGLLEQWFADLLTGLGMGERMRREGMFHDGIYLNFDGGLHHLDFRKLIGKGVTIYGQQEVVKDLVAGLLAEGVQILFEVDEVSIHDFEHGAPKIRFRHGGETQVLDCDFIGGCDGFHGVCRPSFPAGLLQTFERDYPFGWIGIWPDARIWDELHTRMDGVRALAEGRLLQKGITPMRSFVVEPMQAGRLFLAGDSAHIVPPTGAKGMNLAIADVVVLSRALTAFYRSNRTDLLDSYSKTCLARVWKAQRFSWWMTQIFHRFPDEVPFDQRRQLAELGYVAASAAAATALAENYAGLPMD